MIVFFFLENVNFYIFFDFVLKKLYICKCKRLVSLIVSFLLI